MKIAIKTSESGGPRIFLTRLSRNLLKKGILTNLNDYDVLITTNMSTIKKISNKKVLLRLDGAYFEDFTSVDLYHFIKFRTNVKILKKISKLYSFFYTKDKFQLLYNYFLRSPFSKFFSNFQNKKLVAKKPDFIVYQSLFAKKSFEFLLSNYLRYIQNEIIYNGVNLNQFKPNSNKNRDEYELVLLCSGKFRFWKRLQDAIRALPLIIKEIPDTILYIIGMDDGSVFTYINNLIRKFNLKNHVRFLGNMHFDKLAKYYSSADIMIHLAWVDPCPNVVIESLASGTPVICTNTGGTPELVGKAGKIIYEEYKFGFKSTYNLNEIPKVDSKEILNSIMVIKSKINQYSKLARKRAEEKFDIKKIADKYLDICHKLC